ncbi:MAG: hypothetical protein ACOY93_05225 [Bacillota bacterium]
MTSLFLYTFFVGFGLTVISVILGMVDLGGSDAGSSADLSSGDLSSGDLVPGDLSHGGDLSHHGHGSHGHSLGKIASISPVNFQTIVAALTGFGGVGYAVSTAGVAGLIIPVLAAMGGAVGTAWLIFKFQRFLARGERPMGPTSYTGLIGRLTVPIREGGTGEVVYTQQDSRMVSAARSIDGRAIPRGEQVVILRYEKGVAYVQLWREFMDQKTE